MSPTHSSSETISRRPLRVAIAGNPNCGKTTIFNQLTGLRHKVANYPGVTVEKKEGELRLGEQESVSLIDLPGIYHLFGSALDEQIATQVLLGELRSEAAPDLIVLVLDASNFERNFYLASQVLDLGIPCIVLLNMLDIARKRGIFIREQLLERLLGVPVVALSAHDKSAIESLRQRIAQCLSQQCLQQSPQAATKPYAWAAIGSAFIASACELGAQEHEKLSDTLSEARRQAVCCARGASLLSGARTAQTPALIQRVAAVQENLRQAGIDCQSYEATARYQWINSLAQQVLRQEEARASLAQAIDKILMHKVLGLLAFVGLMFVLFQSIFIVASVPMDYIDSSVSAIGSMLAARMPEGILRSLLVDGLVAGVGSVLVFVPQIAILFLFLGLLEDSGYLARAAFIMDRLMRPVGLQGRSFIPLLGSFACAIPGIMSTRTIPSFADRMTTILIAPLMSCSARLPVYTVLIAAFIPSTPLFGLISLQGVVLLGMYLLGVVTAGGIAWLLRRTLFRGEPALFVMEMPPFRRPAMATVLRDVWDRVLIFLKSAGTVILACSIVLWFLASFPRGPVAESFAGQLGRLLEPLIAPLGFGWEIGIGILASFAAREVFVSSLATVYNLESAGEGSQSLVAALSERYADGRFSLAAAISLMVFYVFACQCISTLAVCKRETASWRWPAFMLIYMTVLAYSMAFVTYQALSRLWGL
jgi:ferrous iron transport protein B